MSGPAGRALDGMSAAPNFHSRIMGIARRLLLSHATCHFPPSPLNGLHTEVPDARRS